MKGTAGPIVAALFISSDIAADHFRNIVFLLQLLHEAGIEPPASAAHTVTPPKEKFSGINSASNTLIAYLSVMPDR